MDFMLIALILSVISVIFTQLVTEGLASNDVDLRNWELLKKHFGSVGSSFLSLFQCITGGLDWEELSTGLAEGVHPLMAPVFTVYIAFSLIAVFNVVTGMVVQFSQRSSKEDNDIFFIESVREVFKHANGGSVTHLTWTDFQEQLGKTHVRDCLKAIDINPCEARGLFTLLDLDNSGTIDAEEFLSGCLRIRGPAKALELVLVLKELTSMHQDMQNHHIWLESFLLNGGNNYDKERFQNKGGESSKGSLLTMGSPRHQSQVSALDQIMMGVASYSKT